MKYGNKSMETYSWSADIHCINGHSRQILIISLYLKINKENITCHSWSYMPKYKIGSKRMQIQILIGVIFGLKLHFTSSSIKIPTELCLP